MKAHQGQILRHAFSSSLFLGALLSWNVMAGYGQESAPKRGFQPGASYALSDIESINTTNGNLMMHVPLASLPVGRGGLTAGINLVYGSKLYNSHTSWSQDFGGGGKFGCPLEGCFYQTNGLGFTNDGGWNYTMQYWVEIVDRTADNSIDPTLQCSASGSPFTYRYKLKLHFPDGSVHEMRPSGFTDGYSEDTLGDYYNVLPDGSTINCATGPGWSTASTISYYSADASYLRLEFQAGNHGGWGNNSWRLYCPNGPRVA